MHKQHSNALVYWIAQIHVLVNSLATLNTDRIPANHGERNLIKILRTFQEDFDRQNSIIKDDLMPCLAYSPQPTNCARRHVMSDLLIMDHTRLRNELEALVKK